MVSAIKSSGLASGLPINDIITQLTDLSKAPIKRLEEKKAKNEAKKTALQFISAQTLGLSLISFNLTKTASFNTKQTTSSDESVLTALASASAAAGTYKFKVGQVAQASQVTSSGFQDKTSAISSSGSITINKGSNTLNQSTSLALINGGKGLASGSIKIADEKGNSAIIDLTTSLSINDVIDKINSNSKLQLNASISKDGNSIQLENSGEGEITVSEVNGGSLAKSLGILGKSSEGTIEGENILYVDRNTKLYNINDGLGIDITAKGINDLIITNSRGNDAGESYQVDLADSITLGDVIDKINTAIGIEDYAYIEEGSNKISFKDDKYTISNGDKSNAATQLGLVGDSNRSGRLIAGFNDSLLRNINGSSGISNGEITISTSSPSTNSITATSNNDEAEEISSANEDDNNTTTNSSNRKSEKIQVDASGSVNDFLAQINESNKLDLVGTYNSSGNGIELASASGDQSIKIEIENREGSTTATELGLLNASVDGTLKSESLIKRKISENTLLSSFNNGKGIGTGSFEVQLSNGEKRTVNFSSKNIKTVKDALIQIQGQFSKTTELEVSINENGDGLSLTDLTTGASTFKVTDKDDQKTGAALNLVGTVTSNSKKIDGTGEVNIEILDTDSLEDIAGKINKLSNLGIKASIINDGTSRDSYRLSLVSETTGASSNISIDSNIEGLDFSTTAQGLDSIVSYGSSQGTGSPITLTSSDLNIVGGINGIDLNIKGASESEITISVERETESVKATIKEFVDKFNETITNIKNLTKFVPPEELKDKINTGQTEEEKANEPDSDAATGLLLGNSTLRKIQGDLFNLVSSNIVGATGQIKSLSQVGVEFQSNGQLEFDDAKFDSTFKSNPDDVIELFTLSKNILNRNTNNTGASISGGLTIGSGFNAGNLLDENSSSSGYNEDGGDIGVKFSGKGYIDFNLGGIKNIKKLSLSQIDTAEFPISEFGLQKFKFQYKDARGQYVDINQYFQNASDKISYTLPQSINTNNLRLEILDGNPADFRLLSFEAFESRGSAFILNDHLKTFTEAETGDLSSAISTYEKSNEDFDQQIARIQAKVDSETDRLTRSFSAMEKIISGLQGQGNVLSQTLSNLPKTNS